MNPERFASLFVVPADTFTSIACPSAPIKQPGGNDTVSANAAENRFRHNTVVDGDSTVTIAAASDDTVICVATYRLSAFDGADFVTVTPPPSVSAPVAVHLSLIFPKYGSPAKPTTTLREPSPQSTSNQDPHAPKTSHPARRPAGAPTPPPNPTHASPQETPATTPPSQTTHTTCAYRFPFTTFTLIGLRQRPVSPSNTRPPTRTDPSSNTRTLEEPPDRLPGTTHHP